MRIALPLLCLICFLAVPASAAFIEVTAPDSINAGKPLEATGTTIGVKPGYVVDIVLYDTTYGKSEIDRQAVVIQGDGTFNLTFETDDLRSGTYSVEVQSRGDDIFGGSSKKIKIFKVVNRNDELSITSPKTQDYDGTLTVAGTLAKSGDDGLRLTVTNADNATIYGPKWIQTDAGAFSVPVPVTSGGTYMAEIADRSGYTWTTQFTVKGGVAEVTPTVSQTPGPTYSASAPASRGNPAYFAIETLGGQVTISTSTGTDWVLEYIDEKGERSIVNNQGTTAPESVTLPATGGIVYVKVTPQLYTETGTVTVAAANIKKISVDAAVAGKFGDPVPTTAQSPMPFGLVLLALGAVFLLFRKI
ncbi:hypothetical protein [uncultured Methanofollis sp.]|uniref:hypothetical protein n=1 Tax=uncultured Methanofollis sp. TaxID=262500 RepID=UPI0026311FC4|nr:hypothetical protein [uncultured Methanofollis sp.]